MKTWLLKISGRPVGKGKLTFSLSPRTDSDKLRRRQLREEFLPPDSDSDTAEDEAESPPRSPSPPPPPRKRESVKIVIDETPASEEDSETEAFNRSLDRAPSAKSVVVASPASAAASRGHHVNRVKDKFRPSVVAAAGLNKEAAAARLHRALHDSPTDVDTVIEVLTSHSHDQRKKIAKAYKFNHNKVKPAFYFPFPQFHQLSISSC